MTLPARVRMNDRVNQKVNDRINEKDLGRTIVICPKCGENNSNTFRFCGMCGTLLEARRPANATAPASPVAASNLVIAQEPQRSAVVQNTVRDVAENSPRPISRQVPPISGPSMLGLNADPPVADRPTIDRPSLDRPSLDRPSVNQPGVSRPVLSQPGLNQPALHQSALNQIGFSQPKSNQRGMNEPVPVRPEMDSFRPTSFTGLDSFFEHEQPKKTSALRVVLLVVLLAALAAAGWWTYGYLDNAESRKSQVASNAGKPAATPSETQNEPPNTSTNNSPNVPSSVASNKFLRTTVHPPRQALKMPLRRPMPDLRKFRLRRPLFLKSRRKTRIPLPTLPQPSQLRGQSHPPKVRR